MGERRNERRRISLGPTLAQQNKAHERLMRRRKKDATPMPTDAPAPVGMNLPELCQIYDATRGDMRRDVAPETIQPPMDLDRLIDLFEADLIAWRYNPRCCLTEKGVAAVERARKPFEPQPEPAPAPPAAELTLTAEEEAEMRCSLSEFLPRPTLDTFHMTKGEARRLFATLDAERVARAAAELERTQWRARESETQEALQAIGEEFGVHGGEPRVAGTRRVLTELRARAEAAERERDELLAPDAEDLRRLIQQLRALEALATPAPWKIYQDGIHPAPPNSGGNPNDWYAIAGRCFGPDAGANKSLIVALRNALPDILAHLGRIDSLHVMLELAEAAAERRVRELEAENAKLRSACRGGNALADNVELMRLVADHVAEGCPQRAIVVRALRERAGFIEAALAARAEGA